MTGFRFVSVTPAALGLLSLSCVLGPAPVSAKNVLQGAYCAPQEVLDPAWTRPPPENESLSARVAIERGYSARAIDTARAIGAIAAIERLAEAEARGAPDPETVDLRGQVNDAITVATLDVASVVAHLQCEEGRAGQIANDLRDAEQKQERRLTAYSLVVSAASAIGAGILAIALKDQTDASIVGISGGVVGGALGFGTLAVRRTTPFPHGSILGQVWRGGDHPSFPSNVWAFLTRPQFSKSGDRSMRDGVTDAWKQSGRLGSDPARPSAERVGLYFGNGGVYDTKGLDDRANMLSEVREVVSLMSHDLRLLASEAAHR